MQTYILSEGVLNDNELLLPDEGKVFKGKFIAIVKEYIFASEWANKKIQKARPIAKVFKQILP